MPKILFYEGKYYCFSNFSSHEVIFLDKRYKTAEHCYQSQKFIDPEIKTEIESAPSPFMAKKISHQHDEKKRKDWEEIKTDIMKQIITEKVKQHDEVRELLQDTGNNEICDNTPFDYFWGIGENGNGKNFLGKILMDIRSEIKS